VGQKKAFSENEAKTLRYINTLKILRRRRWHFVPLARAMAVRRLSASFQQFSLNATSSGLNLPRYRPPAPEATVCLEQRSWPNELPKVALQSDLDGVDQYASTAIANDGMPLKQISRIMCWDYCVPDRHRGSGLAHPGGRIQANRC
jgi:hypothetical protein